MGQQAQCLQIFNMEHRTFINRQLTCFPSSSSKLHFSRKPIYSVRLLYRLNAFKWWFTGVLPSKQYYCWCQHAVMTQNYCLQPSHRTHGRCPLQRNNQAGFKISGLICYLALFENIAGSGVSLTKTDASVDRVHYEPRWNKEIS